MTPETDALHRIDRLWPQPASGLSLADAMADFAVPSAHGGRPHVAVNMVTSIDGRAQLDDTAEGLGTRTDRRLMRHYRASFDAVASGAGTLRAADLWLRVGDELAARRAAAGRSRNPLGVVIAGTDSVPLEARWFSGDEKRILVVGRDNPIVDAPAGTELLRAPDERPAPAWVLDRLMERGIGSLLLEGGPHLNAAFLAAGLIDEVYWTVAPQLHGTDALPMIAPIPGGVTAMRAGYLTSVLRTDDELFLRYRFDR